MTDPTPPPVRTEPEFDYTARLAERRPMHDRPDATSWFVTFGFGKPAASTYTEVAFADTALADEDEHFQHPEHVLDAVVRRVAADLYGQAWAFHYRPEQYDEAIGRYPVRLREKVVVSSIEVWA